MPISTSSLATTKFTLSLAGFRLQASTRFWLSALLTVNSSKYSEGAWNFHRPTSSHTWLLCMQIVEARGIHRRSHHVLANGYQAASARSVQFSCGRTHDEELLEDNQ